VWPAGAAAWLLVAVGRLVRFQRLLRFAEPAPVELQNEAQRLAAAMGVRCPPVLLLPGTISPMLWALGGAPRLLLPAELLGRLRPAQQATLLAHELAHWRRGDHRTRWLEIAALAVYWWCPFVWWACRQLQQAEEECCDAWVVALFPDVARDYALTLVETIDFLSGAPQSLPPVASGVGHVRLLKRRLTMILRGATPQSLTRRGLLLLAGLGLMLLPFVPAVAQKPANPDPDQQRTAELLRALLNKHPDDETVRRAAELLKAGQQHQLAQAQDDLQAKRAQAGGQFRHATRRPDGGGTEDAAGHDAGFRHAGHDGGRFHAQGRRQGQQRRATAGRDRAEAGHPAVGNQQPAASVTSGGGASRAGQPTAAGASPERARAATAQ
jgi:hypothetical protein